MRPSGVNLDTANALGCGQDPAEMLAEVIDQVRTVHLNDILDTNEMNPALIGSGLVDFDSVFHVLNGHRFVGWVSIGECSFTGGEGIGKAMQFARRYIPA